MKLMLVLFVAAIVLGGGIAKAADFTWAQKADMPTGRWTHTSAVVNGKIYVIGGSPSEPSNNSLSTVEEYDPATDKWARKANMPTERCDFSGSSAVVNGKIYVIGGDVFDGGWKCVPIVEEYNPATDTWTRKANMPTSRWCVATCAVDGKIYAIGGAPDSYTGLKVVEQYDPITDTWTTKADMPTGLWGLCAKVVNGKIYAFGGRPGTTAVPNTYEYDPVSDTWVRKADMPLATSQMASAVLGDRIVVIGGWHISTQSPYATVQIYHPETDTWILEDDVPFLRACCTAELVNNKIYIIGGTDRPHPCPAFSTVYTTEPIGDFNGDGFCDIDDLVIMIENWETDNSLCDIGPFAWGDGIVDRADLEVLMEYWGQEVNDPTLIAHWPLNETEGIITEEIVGDKDGTVFGDPNWQPEGGMIDGAIELDGIDDYVSTPFVLNPRETSEFSVFAWVKGGLPGQVILSQADGVNWLLADSLDGCLMTELRYIGGREEQPSLISSALITDGGWHRVGFVWDGTNRILYVDDFEVASDTQSHLTGSEGGLYIGAGKDIEPGTFFSGLIDDVRIYDRVIIP